MSVLPAYILNRATGSGERETSSPPAIRETSLDAGRVQAVSACDRRRPGTVSGCGGGTEQSGEPVSCRRNQGRLQHQPGSWLQLSALAQHVQCPSTPVPVDPCRPDPGYRRPRLEEPLHLSVLGGTGIQQPIRLIQGRRNGCGPAHVRASHPETRTDSVGGQLVGHAQEFGVILHDVPRPDSACSGLCRGSIRN